MQNSIMTAEYPASERVEIDTEAFAYVDKLKRLVEAFRALRSSLNVQGSKRIPVCASFNNPDDLKFLMEAAPIIKSMAKISELKLLNEDEFAIESKAASVSVVGQIKVCIILEIDLEAERERLTKEALRLTVEIKKIQSKLDNEAFVSKAPAKLVESERNRVAEYETTLHKINEQISSL